VYAINNKFLFLEDYTQSHINFDHFRTLIVIIFIVLSLLAILLAIVTLLLFRKNQEYRESKKQIDNHNYLLKSFIDADKSLIYLKDEKLHYLFVNNAFLLFYGITEEDIIGKDDFAISVKAFAQFRRETDFAVLNEKRLITDEVRWQGRIYQTIKFPVRLLNRADGVGAFVKDITDEYLRRRIIDQSALRNEILYEIFIRDNILPEEEYDYILAAAIRLTESSHGVLVYRDANNTNFVYNTRTIGFNQYNSKEKSIIINLVENFIYNDDISQVSPFFDNNAQEYLEKHGINNIDINRVLSVPVIGDYEFCLMIVLFNKPYEYDENDTHQISVLLRGLWNKLMHKKSTEELRIALHNITKNEARLQLILDSTAEAICGIDTEGNCVFCNNSGLDILGYSDQTELIGKNIHKLLHHSRPDGSEIPIEKCQICRDIHKGEIVHGDNEHFWRKDGTYFAVEYHCFPQYDNEEIVGAVITFSDITNRKKAEDEIVFLSYHDPLTGLYNRRFFEEELKRLDVKRNLPLSIIMGDVNGLKLTNDVFGHAAGDNVLKEAATIFRSACRADDIIARWGGDEFIVILPNTPSQDVVKVANRISKAFNNFQNLPLKYSISLGYATKKSEEEKIDWIVIRAEELMYLDKTTNIKSIDYENIKTIYRRLHLNPRNKEHAEMVRHYSKKIGQHLQFSAAEMRLLKEVAFYHDIGKIALSEESLESGPDYRKHPTVGFRILNISEKTMEVAKYVLSHHERWDGSGYPKGLKGEAIPLLSRIVAVAEHYDNLRRNKEHLLNKDEALSRLAAKAGTTFDPDIVAAFIEIISNEKNDD